MDPEPTGPLSCRIHQSSYFALRPGRCSNREYRGPRVNKAIQAWFEGGREFLYLPASEGNDTGSEEVDPAEASTPENLNDGRI